MHSLRLASRSTRSRSRSTSTRSRSRPWQTPGSAGVYTITMSQFEQRLHSQLPATTVWGYNGSYPGLTIEARSGVPTTVRWVNDVPTPHLLESAIDETLDGAAEGADVRAVTHLHGGHVPPAVDGGPDDWFVPGQSVEYVYPNSQQAATLWYHDHALGITRLNVYAGLAGFYLLRDPHEDSLGLPSGQYEIPLVIQDRMFDQDGQLLYPNQGVTAEHPIWSPEFFGDTVLVNGKVWPYLTVEPRKYRFRILNGSNARFYTLRLGTEGTLPFHQIGSDGGLLPATATLDSLTLAPGERADVIVDFSPYAGQTFVLRNTAKTPFPMGTPPDPRSTGQVMQFRVLPTASSLDLSAIPTSPRPLDRLDEAGAANVRDVRLVEYLDANGEPLTALIDDKMWRDPTDIFPTLGTSEMWRVINTTGDTHPIHLHLVQFQVLDRQRFDQRTYSSSGELRLLGSPRSPAPGESGWKDTVQANPGEVTRIVATFDIAGKYPFHCDILEHEDNDMMRPFEVRPRPSS